MYINKAIKVYLDDLAAKKPTPGGGSAAALSAAIGAGLVSMVANYTMGNPAYKAYQDKIADILVRAENYRLELEALVDGDVDAYGKLLKGLKVADPNSDKVEALYKEALRPPFEICKITSECLRLCKTIAGCGNKNLITDVAIAAILLEGAFFSAKFNVYINLKYVKDMNYVGQIHGLLAPLEGELPALKEEILGMCEEVIR
ncbi:MAG: cyclodeaminase/cyclohydrolase family protein [Candidatus Omnitrophica bacterium]|nr:cyclodeaminase/cyclohydrolase family protein [Candidatus Omnitrophota bacterium]